MAEEAARERKRDSTAAAIMGKYTSQLDSLVGEIKSLKELLSDTSHKGSPPKGPSYLDAISINASSLADTADLETAKHMMIGSMQRCRIIQYYYALKNKDPKRSEVYVDVEDGRLEKELALMFGKEPLYIVLISQLNIPIEINRQRNEYSGGQAIGKIWLADVRKKKIISSMTFVEDPGDVMTFSKEDEELIKSQLQSQLDMKLSQKVLKWLMNIPQ